MTTFSVGLPSSPERAAVSVRGSADATPDQQVVGENTARDGNAVVHIGACRAGKTAQEMIDLAFTMSA